MKTLLKQTLKATLAILLVLGSISFSQAWSEECENPLSKTARESLQIEVDAILQSIESNYGPLLLKKQSVGLDWPKVRAQFEKEMKSAVSVRDFYMATARLLASLKDAHVSIQLPSNYRHSLPMQFLYVNGKTLILSASPLVKDEQGRMLDRGDEVLSIDVETPDALREKLKAFGSVGNESTDPILLSFMLTAQRESRGLPINTIPYRTSTLQIRKVSGEIVSVNSNWNISGTPLISKNFDPVKKPEFSIAQNKEEELDPADMSFAQRMERILNLSDRMLQTRVDAGMVPKADEGFGIGSQNPFFKLPADYKELEANWYQKLLTGPLEKMSGLTAGTFTRNGKKVGFLRIPSYVPANIMLSLFGLRSIIAKLEKETDYLVIDQTNNPGGYVMFSDWIIWSLTGKHDPAKHMGFGVRPTQGFLRQYADLIDSIKNENTFSQATKLRYVPLFQAEFEKIKKAFETSAFMSEPISLAYLSEFYEEMISENMTDFLNSKFSKATSALATILGGIDLSKRQIYTKPVYMMINELDFSGGDATPANLQDYGRVTLLGARTAGAGGAVGSFNSTIMNDFSFHLTNSLMIRRNLTQRYVENYGILPDVAVQLVEEDLRDGFANYFERFLVQIDKLQAAR